MTDSEKLWAKVRASGLSVTFLSKQLGINRATLYHKLNGGKEFWQSEIAVLCELLRIDTIEELNALFFNPKVDK